MLRELRRQSVVDQLVLEAGVECDAAYVKPPPREVEVVDVNGITMIATLGLGLAMVSFTTLASLRHFRERTAKRREGTMNSAKLASALLWHPVMTKAKRGTMLALLLTSLVLFIWAAFAVSIQLGTSITLAKQTPSLELKELLVLTMPDTIKLM